MVTPMCLVHCSLGTSTRTPDSRIFLKRGEIESRVTLQLSGIKSNKDKTSQQLKIMCFKFIGTKNLWFQKNSGQFKKKKN